MKKSILVFIILSTLASAINYATYPLLGRILPASEYVNVTVSLSLLTQITTFLSSIIAITIGLSKGNDQSKINDKIQLLQSSLFKLFLCLTILFVCFSPIIMGYIKTPLPFALPIALMMLVSVPIAIVSGYLNGRNLMIKLGLVAVISASFQFITGALAAYTSHSGFLSLLTMSLSQIGSIMLIYLLFASDKLPKLTGILRRLDTQVSSRYIRSLLLYTLYASLAVMAINVVQIADLLIIQTLHNSNIKFYTDIYVVSRIVFFGGMIFIWPFLGKISIDNHQLNRRPFIEIIGIFTLITLGAIVGLYFFGAFITNLLFGTTYSLSDVQHIGILSVLYKFFFLIITASVLYFVVLRSYVALWLSAILCGIILVYAVTLNKGASIEDVLLSINLVTGLSAAASIILVIIRPIKQKV